MQSRSQAQSAPLTRTCSVESVSAQNLVRFILKCPRVLFVVLVLAGINYGQIGEKLDRKRFPQVDRSVDIGRRYLSSSYSINPRHVSPTVSPASNTADNVLAAFL